jgi:hypothetical protein
MPVEPPHRSLLQGYGRWDRRFYKERPRLAAFLMSVPAVAVGVAGRSHGEVGLVARLALGAIALTILGGLVVYGTRQRKTSQHDIDRYLEKRAAERQ